MYLSVCVSVYVIRKRHSVCTCVVRGEVICVCVCVKGREREREREREEDREIQARS